MVSWISRDDPTSTRSLVANHSPYYSSGARLVWQATPRLTARLDVVNGWENVSESDGDKSIWAHIDPALTTAATLSYHDFVVNESGARVARAGLVERFHAPGQVLIATGSGLPGFRANGASLRSDVVPIEQFPWRSEVRGYQSGDGIFPDRDTTDTLARRSAFVVTSLALTF